MDDAAFSQQVKDKFEAKMLAHQRKARGYIEKCVNAHIEFMRNLIGISEKTGTETGVWFCKGPNGECLVGSMCTGNACSVAIRDCTGHEELGTFHTHPGDSIARMSQADVRHDIGGSCEFSCIGNVSEGVRCFSIKYDSPVVNKYIELWKKAYFDCEPLFDAIQESAEMIVERGIGVLRRPSPEKMKLIEGAAEGHITYANFRDAITTVRNVMRFAFPDEYGKRLKRFENMYQDFDYAAASCDAFLKKNYLDMYVEHKTDSI